MSFAEYAHTDGVGLAELVRRKEVTPAELVESAIQVIERHNPTVNAVIHRLDDMARAAAGTVSEGPLCGVPFLLKDIGARCAGAPYSEGSKIFKDYIADSDTELVVRFKRAGVNICGKTNVPEFGYNSSTESDFLVPAATPGIPNVPPAALPAVRRQPWPRAWFPSPMLATAAARSESPPPPVAWWG